MNKSQKKLEVFAPFDGKYLSSLNFQSEEEVFSILDQAQKLFVNTSKKLSLSQRVQILEKLCELLLQEKETLARESAQEGGKPLVDSRVEVARAIEGIKIAIHSLSNMHGQEIPMDLNQASLNRIAFTRWHGRGVVLAISAFNHPLNLIVHQVIPAVAVGVPVIVKPAETTPLICFRFLDLLYKAGLPKEWARGIICEIPVAEKLVSDSRVSYLTFIGSAKVGWHLRSKLAPGSHCALEHGGCAPVILDTKCNLEKVIPLLCKGGFYHAGQVCVSVQRIFVPKEILKLFCEKLVLAVSKLFVGDPCQEKTDVGPLILEREVDRVDNWVEEARSKGAKILCGGKKYSSSCFEPTLILNPPKDCKLSTQEVFGPVVCIYEYNNIEDALKEANALDFSFQASVFSDDISFALNTAQKLEANAVMINDHTAFRVDWMPFGGSKSSGLGVGGIPFTMKEMCEQKLYVINNS